MRAKLLIGRERPHLVSRWTVPHRDIFRRTPVIRKPQQEPWGLVEMWIADPEGVRIVLVEVPKDHPLRRDQR